MVKISQSAFDQIMYKDACMIIACIILLSTNEYMSVIKGQSVGSEKSHHTYSFGRIIFTFGRIIFMSLVKAK